MEGSFSWQIFLEVQIHSDSEHSPNRSSKMSHKPEVFVPAKEAAKNPQASFSRHNALLLSIAESSSMYKD